MRKNLWRLRLLFLFIIISIMNWRTVAIATAQFSVTDTMTIYYQIDANDTNCSGFTTLREFVKHTLPFEWPPESVLMQQQEGIEAFKAGAIAIRTNAVSGYHTKEVLRNGITYLCVIYGRQNYQPNESLDNFPNAQQAVTLTNNIILTHPTATNWEITHGRTIRTGAIDAQYRDDTGYFTFGGTYPWTKQIFDPISTGISKTGMGQEGSRRWAWGKSDSNVDFPKWDYRRILAHYYSEVRFVGVSPNPPDSFRGEIQALLNE